MRFLGIMFALVSTVASAQTTFLDDFNDGNDAGWIRYNPLAAFGGGASFSFLNGGYRIQAAASPLPSILGPGRAGSARLDIGIGDFRASVDLIDWDNTLEQGFGVAARLREPGLGTSDGYWLHYVTRSPALGTGSLVLDRIDNEVPFLLAEVATILDPTRDYRLVFDGHGTFLTGQIFDNSNPTAPLATLVVNDSTYAFGSAGLLVSHLIVGADGEADATFDNFSVTAVPEPKTLGLFSIGLTSLIYCSQIRRRASSTKRSVS